MRYVAVTHFLKRQGCIHRTTTSGAKNNGALILAKIISIVRTCRICPKLKHSAGDVLGARNSPEINNLLNLSEINQQQIRICRRLTLEIINTEVLYISFKSIGMIKDIANSDGIPLVYWPIEKPD